MGKRHLGLKIFLIGAVCFAALFNLETSPFRFIVPSSPFSECLGNQLSGDTYVYLYAGDLVTQGLMPYRDLFDHKGPLLYLIMAFGVSIGRVAGVWLVQSALLAVSARYAYKTARLLAGRAASVLAASLAVMWYSLGETGPDTFAVPFLLVSLWHFTRFLLRGGRIGMGEAFFSGVCFGAVALLKMSLATLWVVFVAAVIAFAVKRKEYLFLLRRTLFFLLGAALVGTPVLLWLYLKGAFPDFVADYWHFNLRGYGDAPPFSNYLVYFCPVIFRRNVTALAHWVLYFWFNLPALILYLCMIREKSVPRRIFGLCMTAYLLLTIGMIGAKGWVFIYYCLPMTAVYLPFFAIGFDFILRLGRRSRPGAAVLFLLLTAPVLHALCIPPASDWAKRRIAARFFPETDLGAFGVPVRFDRPALELADWLRGHTAADARINGTGFSVYWYAHRRCANFYPFEPGEKLAEKGEQPLTPFRPQSFLPAQKSYKLTFVEDESGNPPEYIFLRRREDLRFGKHLLAARGERKRLETTPEIEKRLAEDYEMVYQNGTFDLYRLKTR